MRKNAPQNTAEAPVQRTMLRSRSTMSHAFEAAVYDLLAREGSLNSRQGDISVMVANSIDGAYRKRPSWTVSKRPEKKTARKRR